MRLLITLTLSHLVTSISPACANTDTLDRFMTGGCTCEGGYFHVAANELSAAMGPSSSASTIGSVTGENGFGCTMRPLLCYPVNSIFCASDSISPDSYYFYYSPTKYSIMPNTFSSLPTSADSSDKRYCVWSAEGRYTSTATNYLAVGLSKDQSIICQYYGPSPPVTSTAISSSLPMAWLLVLMVSYAMLD
jgi:hypothetical protein